MSHTKFTGWQSEKDFTAWDEETERIDRELAERFIKLIKARRRRQTISHNRAKLLKAAIIGLGLTLLLIWYGFKPLPWAIAKLLGWGTRILEPGRLLHSFFPLPVLTVPTMRLRK